jgi:DNA-binding beta-propeller fold protein YncE
VRAALSQDQRHLFVAEGSQDAAAVISTKNYRILEQIGTVSPSDVFANRLGFKGASPNSVAVSPDNSRLYVTNAGANDVAVVQLGGNGRTNDDSYWQKSRVLGLIPTGWYPKIRKLAAIRPPTCLAETRTPATPPINMFGNSPRLDSIYTWCSESASS